MKKAGSDPSLLRSKGVIRERVRFPLPRSQSDQVASGYPSKGEVMLLTTKPVGSQVRSV